MSCKIYNVLSKYLWFNEAHLLVSSALQRRDILQTIESRRLENKETNTQVSYLLRWIWSWNVCLESPLNGKSPWTFSECPGRTIDAGTFYIWHRSVVCVFYTETLWMRRSVCAAGERWAFFAARLVQISYGPIYCYWCEFAFLQGWCWLVTDLSTVIDVHLSFRLVKAAHRSLKWGSVQVFTHASSEVLWNFRLSLLCFPCLCLSYSTSTAALHVLFFFVLFCFLFFRFVLYCYFLFSLSYFVFLSLVSLCKTAFTSEFHFQMYTIVHFDSCCFSLRF